MWLGCWLVAQPSSQPDRQAESGCSEATDQLLQVVLDPRQVGERTDGHQAAQSKVKQLVAEERDEPAVAMLKETSGEKKNQFHFSRSSPTQETFNLCIERKARRSYWLLQSSIILSAIKSSLGLGRGQGVFCLYSILSVLLQKITVSIFLAISRVTVNQFQNSIPSITGLRRALVGSRRVW